MDARLQRTVFRLVAMLVILAAGMAIVILVQDIQIRVLGIGLAAAAVLALEEWLKNSGELAPPTVAAVNQALQPGSVGQVAEPKEKPPGEITSAVATVPPNQPPT